MANNLIIDFSEDFVTLSHQGKVVVTSVSVEQFLGAADKVSDQIKAELRENNLYYGDWVGDMNDAPEQAESEESNEDSDTF